MPTLSPRPAASGLESSAGPYRAALSQTPPPLARLDLALFERTLGCEVVPATAPAAPAATTVRAAFPRVGETFLGFELVSELGSGAFGKVFFARQLGLAGRPVALKVTTRPTAEPQQLAKLGHANIVPIYSVHDAAPLQAVCMPYLGARTLADVVGPYRATDVFAATRPASAATKALGLTASATPCLDPAAGAPTARPPVGVLDGLSTAGQLDWVVRTVRGVAEGLAHAHARGVLHLDLKPANVLIADDGAPRLLDFNLALDRTAGPREQTGGTLPYMAPEQLDGFRDRDDRHLDARTDLFGLGVIFYELLTGRPPFPAPAGPRPDLARMARDRRAGADAVRLHNPAVPHAVAAIVAALLEPLPARRYPSADALVADLTRHLESRPLAFAAEPSARERLTKWRRRNARLGAATLTAALGLAVAFAAAAGAPVPRGDDHSGAAAAEGDRDARAGLATLRLDLLDGHDAAARAAATQKAGTYLSRHGLEPGRPWVPTAAFRGLPAARQAEVADEAGELCRLVAAVAAVAAAPAGAEGGAADWVALGQLCPAANDPAAGESAAETLVGGVRHALAGRYALALRPLTSAADRRPADAAAQFALAACRHELGDYGPAAERYLVARTLAPESGRPSLRRGAIDLLRGHAAEAELEATDALERDPALAAAYRLRAAARRRQGRPAEAETDLTHALRLEPDSAAGYCARAEVRAAQGDAAGAADDRRNALQAEPSRADDFVARGVLRAGDDPEGAEGDFRRAAALDPLAAAPWQNLAHLAQQRGDESEAVGFQEQAVAAAPGSGPARLGLAMLHAQAGRRDAAHDAARVGLTLGGRTVRYEAARVYAVTARDEPADAGLALGHLKAALRAGPLDPDRVERDPAFDDLHDGDDFRALLAAARAFAAGGA